jgi:crotonobetainyl-CoA:carnitine CoA-transferase CaiB-like acyl-CoA transferase
MPTLEAGVPRVQFADITTGLLASSAILAALLQRRAAGRGRRLVQPLLAAPLPLLAWAWADRAAGSPGLSETMLSGRAACYRCYRCGDDRWISVGCLEPKFWIAFVELIGLPELGAGGSSVTAAGAEVAATVSARLAEHPRTHWLALLEPHALPVAAVADLDAAMADPTLDDPRLLEQLPLPDGSRLRVPGPALPSIGRTPDRPAPRLGADTERVLAEMRGR